MEYDSKSAFVYILCNKDYTKSSPKKKKRHNFGYAYPIKQYDNKNLSSALKVTEHIALKTDMYLILCDVIDHFFIKKKSFREI